VAAASADSAWMIGNDNGAPPTPWLLHWNGTAWKLAPSPISAGYDILRGIAAVSARSLWAVGGNINTGNMLSMHYNGTAWKQVPALSPTNGDLRGVASAFGGAAWAVGATGSKTLIMRWNGKAWTRVPSPSPAGSSSLIGVTAVSASSAWAVGCTAGCGATSKTLILQWNGKTWA
jgi:hypothetical protein